MKERLKQLDVFRIFAIAIIILSHFEFLEKTCGSIYINYLHNPTLGVDYFFLLSGFGVCYANSEKKMVGGIKSVNYAINKIKKIYIPYVISLFFSLPIWINHLKTLDGVKIVGSRFLITLTLLQSLTGNSSYTHSINAVGWFISTLFLCYIFLPTFVNFLNEKIHSKKSSYFVLFALDISLLLVLCIFKIMQSKIVFFDNILYTSPFVRVFYVYIGASLAKLYEFNGLDENNKKYTFLEISIIILCLVWFILRNKLRFFFIIEYFMDIQFVSILLYIFSLKQGILSRALYNNDILNSIQKYVMYIYLFHYPIRIYVDKIFSILNLENIFFQMAECMLILFITCVISITIDKLLKKKKSHKNIISF